MTPANIYTADLNNDGIDDVIQDTAQSPAGFTLSLGNGDGTFKAPVFYKFPTTTTGVMAMTTGDFNNDGKADVAVMLSSTNQIAVYLGNGDGTFPAPKISTLPLATGFGFTNLGSAAADFNGDGNVDLVTYADSPNMSNPGTSNATQLYVLQGDGTGGFLNPHLLLTGPPRYLMFQVFVGDFDADGKADIVTTQPIGGGIGGGASSTTLHVLYGNNDFTFTDTGQYTSLGSLTIASGDLNSDGFSDVFGDTGTQLLFFYGNSSRTFNIYFNILVTANNGAPSDGWSPQAQYVMGDFNGDGRMDLATYYNTQTTGAENGVKFYLAGANPGEFTVQTMTLPYNYTWTTAPLVGLFHNHLTPALVFNQSPNGGGPPQNTPSYLVTERNQATSGYFGPCYFPTSGQGFNVCVPGTVSGSTANFKASANSFGKMRKIELWVDGKKVSEQHHTWDQHAYFNFSSTFAAGPHSATFFAADVDNRLQRYDMTFTIGGGACSAPSTPSVHVCSPANYSTDTSPVQALATATITGSLARMELWVDGVKKYTETTSLTVNLPLTLGSGQHKIDFYAANTAGMLWETTAWATVP
jgi:hypothetical protein